MPGRSPSEEQAFRLFAARRHLLENLEHRRTVPEIARLVGMSSFHFLRVFRRTFGETPHQMFMGFRLARAKDLLVETNLSVTEICFECGYESLGSFSTLFRSATGLSPREFRARRRRLWPVAITFPHPIAPFCLLDVFR